jgi:2-dehydropantoate 2-reductase
MRRITIIGAGAMGSLFGGLLASVAQVGLVDPWREHVETIRRDGLRLVEPDGEKVIQISATTDPAEAGPADLAIIFLKSHQTEWGAEIARNILKPDGLALTLQNGLGNRDVLARVLGKARAWQGVTAHGATLLGPGQVRHAGRGPTHLETRPDIAGRAEQVAGVFQQAGIETHLSPDLDSLIWGKLVINVGINALTSILRVPNGKLGEMDAARALMDVAVEEAVQVARAKGIALPYDNPIQKVRDVCAATAANRSSMLQDVLRGSPTEIDVINGAIVREADKLSLQAPVNKMLTSFIKAIEASYSARVA